MIALNVFFMLLIVVNPQSTDFEFTETTDETLTSDNTDITTMSSDTTASFNTTVGSIGVSIQQHAIITHFSTNIILFVTMKYMRIYSK
jgi:hypothetical protein